jgi:asparagine synthase (glutamine-hydrolysing)
MAEWLQKLSPQSWDRLKHLLPFIPVLQKKRLGEKVHKMARILPMATRYSLYRVMSSQWDDSEDLVKNSSEPLTALTDEDNWLPTDDFRKQMQYIDQLIYLPDDLLHKVDRASMASGLEVRVPLLDHRIVECSWKFTNSMNLHPYKGKAPLKSILADYVPEKLFLRQKMGFGVPIHDWLRGPLKEWAGDLLSESRLQKQDLFHYDEISKVWQIHQKGTQNLQEPLWAFLMLQAWIDKYQN